MVKVRIYVEGGGDQNSTLTHCRRGFSKLFEKVVPQHRRPRIIACGGRQRAYDMFKYALSSHPDEHIILLVDSEDQVGVAFGEVWNYLQSRDNWDKPAGASNENAHLMVQCMEAWLLVDREALSRYYGNNFKNDKIPQWPNLEEVNKESIFSALKSATQNTNKGEYHKTRHAFDLLGEIDIRKLSNYPYAKRFFDCLITQANS